MVGLFYILGWTTLAVLWPNDSSVGESGLAQLKLTLSQFVCKLGPLAKILVTCPRQRILSLKRYGRRNIIHQDS